MPRLAAALLLLASLAAARAAPAAAWPFALPEDVNCPALPEATVQAFVEGTGKWRWFCGRLFRGPASQHVLVDAPPLRQPPPALTLRMRCPRWLGGRTKLVGGHVLRGAAAAAAAQPATAQYGPFAGAARQLGGGGSGMRRIGGVLLPLAQTKSSWSPAHQAAEVSTAAASPATPPSSPPYRILRFSPEAPPSA